MIPRPKKGNAYATSGLVIFVLTVRQVLQRKHFTAAIWMDVADLAVFGVSGAGLCRGTLPVERR